jgi:hypothetical protein
MKMQDCWAGIDGGRGAFLAFVLRATGAVAFFLMDVIRPGIAPCLMSVMVLTDQAVAIWEAIQASRAQDAQAAAREPVSLTGAGKSPFWISL